MILIEGKQLEGPKGGGNNMPLHDEHVENYEHVENDENEVSTPSKDLTIDVHNSKEIHKDSKIFPQNLILCLCHSLKGWLRLNLTCSLGSF